MEYYLFLLGRLLFGGYFLWSGINHFKHQDHLVSYAKSKGVKPAKSAVLLTGLMLVLGGTGVILGLYHTLALWLIVLFLLVVTFKMHAFWREATSDQKASERRDFLKNMALVGAVLIILSMSTSWPSLF